MRAHCFVNWLSLEISTNTSDVIGTSLYLYAILCQSESSWEIHVAFHVFFLAY